MALKDQLDGDLKDAMRARESLRVETIRSIRGAIKNKEIEIGGELDAAQRARLLEIADRCPVHRTLTSETVVRTRPV